MKEITDSRHEWLLTRELGYQRLNIKVLQSYYQPRFMVYHRKKKTLSYIQVTAYSHKDNYLTSVTVKYSDDSCEELDSFKLDDCLFKQV